MKTKATYQGATKEELELRVLNLENTILNNEMEVWEIKMYSEVINKYKRQIQIINENQKKKN